MLTYISTGGITFKGCANPIKVNKYYKFKYEIGSILYVLKKAKRGVLERVAIRRVNLVDYEGKKPIFNYVDTTNRIWFEQELVWQSDATSFATAYLNKEIQSIACDQQIIVEQTPIF